MKDWKKLKDAKRYEDRKLKRVSKHAELEKPKPELKPMPLN